MRFAENVRKGPAGSLMNAWSSHLIVRECSEYRCKGFRRVSGVNLVLPPPVLGSSATADGWTPELAPFSEPNSPCLGTRERFLFSLSTMVSVPVRSDRSVAVEKVQVGVPSAAPRLQKSIGHPCTLKMVMDEFVRLQRDALAELRRIFLGN